MNPSAPSLEKMDKIPGYEHLTIGQEIMAPPTLLDCQSNPPERQAFENFPLMSSEEVHESVLQYASQNCCYGTGFAKNMNLTEIVMISGFHYTLETFTERRETAWHSEGYYGGHIDGPENGPPPAPWDISASPVWNFQNSISRIEIPHTASVKTCHTCVGNKRVRCNSCRGRGRKQCTWCNGRGKRRRAGNQDERCSSCSGSGYKRCFPCGATGQVSCPTCSGRGELKSYLELVVTWTNHLEDYISNTSHLPKELIRGVTGRIIFEEEQPRVWPISHASDQSVNEASDNMIQRHISSWPNERMLKQRHRLCIIPIAQPHYVWKNKSGNFFVYGFERKAYFTEYPQPCCCCSII